MSDACDTSADARHTVAADARHTVAADARHTAAADARHTAIRRLLDQRAGPDPDAKAIATAAADTWPEVASRLAPVIGARGVDVLFRRALHQTSVAYPWLQIGGDHEAGVAALGRIKTRLAAQEATHAAEASYALLARFTELLAALIGESLTERLLGPVWASRSPAPQQETGR